MQGTQPSDVFIEELLVLLLGFIDWLDQRRTPLELNSFAGMDAEFFSEFFSWLSLISRQDDPVEPDLNRPPAKWIFCAIVEVADLRAAVSILSNDKCRTR